MATEQMRYDVLIVGAGPAGLATALYLRQLGQNSGRSYSICVLEKGSTVGAHSLSGALLDTRCLQKLLKDWQKTPLQTPVKESQFCYLTKRHHVALPGSHLHQKQDYVVSLGELCRFLAEEAEKQDIEIYPSFAASEVLYDEEGKVRGVLTGVSGLNPDETKGPRYEPGVEILATYTVLAEGCRGFLSQQMIQRFQLDANASPQHYCLGIKELWEMDPKKCMPGKVIHTIGWPLYANTYGGGFLYQGHRNLASVGFIVGLDYSNPYLSPFEEFQRFKEHPLIASILKGGRRIGYGARAITEGGLQSLPQLSFPGGVLVGDGAGFLNVQRIKGIHTAIESGILAAEALHKALTSSSQAFSYQGLFEKSALYEELWRARNIRPAFRWGLYGGLAYSVLETYLLRGHSLWTLRDHQKDHQRLLSAKKAKPIKYPHANQITTFDRLSSVFLSGTHHLENEPPHLVLKDVKAAIRTNLAIFEAPETRYCPAQVYEILQKNGESFLQIKAQNCIHCKACDIKDPTQNILWKPPEGGGGPNYTGM